MRKIAQFCLKHGFQMNTHGIGDSANALILDIYKYAFKTNPDHRFRLEHAQVIDPVDFAKFSDFAVFPSVQPTHATSDQRWAEKKWNEYQFALNKVVRLSDHIRYNCPRD